MEYWPSGNSLPMLLMLSLAILVLFLLAFLMWSRRSYFQKGEQYQPQKIKFTSGHFEWHGERYYVKKGQPVLLIHGYTGNFQNWRSMAAELVQRGYDVWVPNLRGHGRGMHRSSASSLRVQEKTSAAGTSTRSAKHKYGFKEIVAEDIPAFVERVYQDCGQKKLILVGHSMGGVAIKAYMHGFHVSEKGEMAANSERARQIAHQYVRSMVIIGSPTRFEHLPASVRWFSHKMPGMAALIQLLLPVPGKPEKQTLRQQLNPLTRIKGKIKQRIVAQMDADLMKRELFQGIINPQNFDEASGELEDLLNHGISKVPMDLIRDVTNWASTGKVIDASGLPFFFSGEITVPTLFVAGDMDRIAPASDILEEAKAFSKFALVRTILLKQTSHVDLINGKRAAGLLAPQIAQFINEPSSLKEHQELGGSTLS